jgi:hypothetical protein
VNNGTGSLKVLEYKHRLFSYYTSFHVIGGIVRLQEQDVVIVTFNYSNA